MKYKVELYNKEFNYFRCRGNAGEDATFINLELSSACDFKVYKDICKQTEDIQKSQDMLAAQLVGSIIEVKCIVPWVSFGDDITVIKEKGIEK